ncbi:MAG: hypothetical protein WBQ26_14850 [Gemmatimonadaceae bacterium]
MDDDDRLPPELMTPLASLSWESAAPPGEEDRAVRALRRRGLLPAPRWQRYAAYAAGVAAALALFVAGNITGASRARARVEQGDAARAWPAPVSNLRSAELRVQRAGSEYVGALVQFAALARAHPATPGLAAGRESAATTLCAAAVQLPRLSSAVSAEWTPCDDKASAPTRADATIHWF